MNYYISLNNQVAGPYTEVQMRSMWLNGTITSETPIRDSKDSNWKPAEKIQRTLEPDLSGIQIFVIFVCVAGVIIGTISAFLGLVPLLFSKVILELLTGWIQILGGIGMAIACIIGAVLVIHAPPKLK